MNEGDVTRMQTDTAVRVGTRGAVFQIAAYRKTDGRQLAADLVMSTGVKTDFHKSGALAIFQHFEVESPRVSRHAPLGCGQRLYCAFHRG